MYASDLVKRARSLANIPKAQYINHDDEVESLWESWKDIYTKITDTAAYDYFIVGPELLDLSTAVQLGPTEWMITLPSDVWKLRFVDYNRNGYWLNMDLFNINQRNQVGGSCKYRWSGDKLWVIGNLPSQIRIRYYQAPKIPSVPDVSYQYALQYQQYELPGVGDTQYFSLPDPVNEGDNDYYIYTYNDTSIVLESYSLNTVQTLYSGTNVTDVRYWLGFVYYIEGGNLYRATTTLTTIGTPTLLASNVSNFSITANNKIVYTGTDNQTHICALDGTGASVLYAYATKDVCQIGTANYAYIKTATDTLYVNTTAVGNMIVQNLTSDGIYLYYLDQAGTVHRLTLDVNYAILGDFALYSNMLYMGPWWGNRISVIDIQYNAKAVSTYEDSEFAYPLNEAWEIMAYQSAIDYKRKSGGDISVLEQRCQEIWARFEDVLQRDSGQPERRIADSQSIMSPYWY